jgi:hypothetical protein
MIRPSEEEIKSAFKEETGRDPTPKELEEFKAQATGPEPGAQGGVKPSE